MGATSIAITINGSDVRATTRVSDLMIRGILNEEVDSAGGTVDGAAPVVGQEILVGLNTTASANRKFGGTIQKVVQTYESAPANRAWLFTAVDYTFLLNRRRPIAAYTAVSASTVAAALIANFSSGFTGTNIAAALPAVTVIFDGSEGFSGCLDQIANQIGGYWYVDYDKDVHLFLTEASAAPDDLDGTHASLMLDPPLTYTTDLSQVRTRVYGRGHGEPALYDAAVGATVLAVANADAWFSASGGKAYVASQILTYTGLGYGYVPNVSTWQARTASAVSNWAKIAWSPALSLFVAVGGDASHFGVMTSPDGVTWTTRTASLSTWSGVAWSPSLNLFCAVATAGTNLVMTSPDGITWTNRTASQANPWQSVVWADTLNLFVAVASTGTNRVMTSPDGITWTNRTAGAALAWQEVTWASSISLLVAGATSGANPIMTSPDGITWTQRTCASGSGAGAIAWSPTLVLFIALGSTGAAFTSPDGTTWTARTPAAVANWTDVVWADGMNLFVAVSSDAATTRIMVSTDGLAWSGYPAPAVGTWFGLAWAPALGTLAAVGLTSGSPAVQVMTSTSALYPTLTGIPASSTGSIGRAIVNGDIVNLWVQRDDAAAQTALAALEGGDGIHEYLVSDERRNVASLTALCDAQLTLFKSPIVTLTYCTRDTKTRVGKTIHVALPAPTSLTGDFTIQDVTIDELDVAPNTWPRHTVVASSVRFSLDDVLRQLLAATA